MSPETTLCPGCNNTFTLRGYQSHLAQSNDPLCSAVFDQLKNAYKTKQRLEEQAAHSSDGPEVNEPEANDFQGGPEAFGLAEVDSDMLEQAQDDLDLEPSDDEDYGEDIEHMVAELEKSWEPPREGAPDHLDDDGTAIIDNEDRDKFKLDPGPEEQELEDSDLNNQRNCDHRYIIGDGYGVKPAVRIRYRDKYLSSHAGEALSQEESRDSGYGAALNSRDNLWSPFNSKEDWEIAKWAKLRGVGSTAFSDLLAIDGVIFMRSVIINKILTYLIGLRSPQSFLQKL